MTFDACAADGSTVWTRSCYSVGGGFVVDVDELDAPVNAAGGTVAYPYRSADELVAMCTASGLSIAG